MAKQTATKRTTASTAPVTTEAPSVESSTVTAEPTVGSTVEPVVSTETPEPVIDEGTKVNTEVVEEPVVLTGPVLSIKAGTYLEMIKQFIADTPRTHSISDSEYSKHQRKLFMAILGVWRLPAEEIGLVLTELNKLWTEHKDGALGDIRVWQFGGQVSLPSTAARDIVKYSLGLFEAMADSSDVANVPSRYKLGPLTELLDPVAAEVVHDYFNK